MTPCPENAASEVVYSVMRGGETSTTKTELKKGYAEMKKNSLGGTYSETGVEIQTMLENALMDLYESQRADRYDDMKEYTYWPALADCSPVTTPQIIHTLFGELTHIGVAVQTAVGFGPGFADKTVCREAAFRGLDLNLLEGKLTFPLRNANGDIVGFAGLRRASESGSRWVISTLPGIPGTDGILFGFQQAKYSGREGFLLCDSITDVFLLHEKGFDNAVCPVGTRLNERHSQTLSKYRGKVVVLGHGKRTPREALRTLSDQGLSVEVLVNPETLADAEDLAGLLNSEEGCKELEEFLSTTVDWDKRTLAQTLNEIFDNCDLARLVDNRIACAKACVAAVVDGFQSKYNDPIFLDAAAGEIAQKTRISKKTLLRALKQCYSFNEIVTDDDLPF